MAEGEDMTIYQQKLAASYGVPRHNIFASPVGPRIMLEAPNDQGSDDAAAKAAADKAAADKAAADKAEADRLAAEKAKSGMTDKEAELLKEVMEKKDALKEAQAALKKFDGIDPEEFARLKAAAEAADAAKRDAERQKAEAEGNTKRLMEMMAEDNQKKIDAIQAEVAAKDAALAAALAQVQELTIGVDFSTSQFVKDELVVPPTKARKLFGDHFDVVDGKTVAFDAPKGAPNRTMLVGSDGKPVAFDDAMKKLVEADPDREQLIKSTMKTGAGSQTTGDKTTVKAPAVFGMARISAALAAGKK